MRLRESDPFEPGSGTLKRSLRARGRCVHHKVPQPPRPPPTANLCVNPKFFVTCVAHASTRSKSTEEDSHTHFRAHTHAHLTTGFSNTSTRTHASTTRTYTQCHSVPRTCGDGSSNTQT